MMSPSTTANWLIGELDEEHAGRTTGKMRRMVHIYNISREQRCISEIKKPLNMYSFDPKTLVHALHLTCLYVRVCWACRSPRPEATFVNQINIICCNT